MEFGFTMPKRKIFVSDVRVRGIGKSDIIEDPTLPASKELPEIEKVHKHFSQKYVH